MPPGSSWSELDGFMISDHDYTLINSDIKDLANKYHEALEKSYRKNHSSSFNERSFRRYFTAFAKCLHFPLKPLRFAFFVSPEIEGPANGILAVVNTNGQHIACFPNSTFTSQLLHDHNLSFILRVSPVVVNDCTTKKMFNTFSASKLLRIHPQEDDVDYKRFFTLVDLYENDGLPLWRIFEPRQLINRVRRFRELLDLFWYVYIVHVRKASLSKVWAGEQERLHP
jgi:UDP-MurNAc hydroxylase